MAAAGLVVGGMVAGVGVAGAAQQAAPATVAVVDTAYQPPAVSVNTGEAVTWNINGAQPHNVEGIEGPDAGWANSAYKTALVTSGTESYTFTQPGSYTYRCTAHPLQMTGTVTVTGEPTEPTPTPPPPTPTPAPPPPAPTPGPSGTPPAPSDTTPAPGSATRDGAAPAISGVRLKAIRRGARVTLTLTETSTVTLRFKRRESGKVVRTARLQVRAGTRTLTVRGSGLKRGRYVVELEARDSSGNAAAVQRASLRIKRTRG